MEGQFYPSLHGGRSVQGGTDRVVLDRDASRVEVHSEDKEQAEPTFKGGFGFYPTLCFADQTGETLAALLRPGNAGANTVTDGQFYPRPCPFCFADFEANAASMTTAVIAVDLVRSFQLLCVDGAWRDARPKALRRTLFHAPGRLVRRFDSTSCAPSTAGRTPPRCSTPTGAPNCSPDHRQVDAAGTPWMMHAPTRLQGRIRPLQTRSSPDQLVAAGSRSPVGAETWPDSPQQNHADHGREESGLH